MASKLDGALAIWDTIFELASEWGITNSASAQQWYEQLQGKQGTASVQRAAHTRIRDELLQRQVLRGTTLTPNYVHFPDSIEHISVVLAVRGVWMALLEYETMASLKDDASEGQTQNASESG